MKIVQMEPVCTKLTCSSPTEVICYANTFKRVASFGGLINTNSPNSDLDFLHGQSQIQAKTCRQVLYECQNTKMKIIH